MNLIDVYKDREKSIRFLYELMLERQREPEYGISFTMPTMQQHRKFVMGKPYRYWQIVCGDVQSPREGIAGPICFEPVWVGCVSATTSNELGIHIKKEYRGNGFGRSALELFMFRHKPLPAIPSVRSGHWLANIAPGNERSIRMFTKLGFKLKQMTYELAV